MRFCCSGKWSLLVELATEICNSGDTIHDKKRMFKLSFHVWWYCFDPRNVCLYCCHLLLYSLLICCRIWCNHGLVHGNSVIVIHLFFDKLVTNTCTVFLKAIEYQNCASCLSGCRKIISLVVWTVIFILACLATVESNMPDLIYFFVCRTVIVSKTLLYIYS